MTRPTARTVLRSRSHQLACLAGSAGCLLLAALNLAVARLSPGAKPAVVPALALIALAVLGLRYAFASIVVDHAARTLIVRNPLRSYRIGLDEIDAIELRDSRFPNVYRNFRQLLAIRPRGGRQLTMVGGCAIGRPAVTRMREQVQAAVYGW